MRLGVLGGTFDPVHVGHLLLGETAREQLELDRVVFVPAGQPWRKAGRQIAPVADRVEMVRLAVDDNPAFAVSTIEAEKEGPSYTYETLEVLGRQNAGAELFFIVGKDALADLPNWRRPERIAELATIAVVRRGESDPPGDCPPYLRGRVVTLAMPRLDISATDVRDRVAAGRSIRYLVPEAVRTYVRERGLYS